VQFEAASLFCGKFAGFVSEHGACAVCAPTADREDDEEEEEK